MDDSLDIGTDALEEWNANRHLAVTGKYGTRYEQYNPRIPMTASFHPFAQYVCSSRVKLPRAGSVRILWCIVHVGTT